MHPDICPDQHRSLKTPRAGTPQGSCSVKYPYNRFSSCQQLEEKLLPIPYNISVNSLLHQGCFAAQLVGSPVVIHQLHKSGFVACNRKLKSQANFSITGGKTSAWCKGSVQQRRKRSCFLALHQRNRLSAGTGSSIFFLSGKKKHAFIQVCFEHAASIFQKKITIS